MQLQSVVQSTFADIRDLNFSDWQKIAAACDNSNVWGFWRWVENADSKQLETVTKAEAKQIAEILGYSFGYVAEIIDQHC